MARRTASRFCVQSECLRLPFGKGRSRRSRRSLVFRGPFLSCSAGFPACATLECEFDPPYFICSPSDSRWRRAPIFNERGPFPPDGSGIEKRTKGESIPLAALPRRPNERLQSAEWRWRSICVSFPRFDAEIFYQDLRVPNERARLRTGRAFVDRPRLRSSRKRSRSRYRASEYVQRSRHGRAKSSWQNGHAGSVGERATRDGVWFSRLYGASAGGGIAASDAASGSCCRHAKIPSRCRLRRGIG